MPMSKKHFEAFANQMRNDVTQEREYLARMVAAGDSQAPSALKALGRIEAYKDAAENFASVASADNPRFQWSRFMSACGLDGV